MRLKSTSAAPKAERRLAPFAVLLRLFRPRMRRVYVGGNLHNAEIADADLPVVVADTLQHGAGLVQLRIGGAGNLTRPRPAGHEQSGDGNGGGSDNLMATAPDCTGG